MSPVAHDPEGGREEMAVELICIFLENFFCQHLKEMHLFKSCIKFYSFTAFWCIGAKTSIIQLIINAFDESEYNTI